MAGINLERHFPATSDVHRSISTSDRARLDCSRNKRDNMASIFYICLSVLHRFEFSLDFAELYFFEQISFFQIADYFSGTQQLGTGKDSAQLPEFRTFV